MIFDTPAEVTRSHRELAARAIRAGGPSVAMWIAGKETQLDRYAEPILPLLPRLAQAFADYERELTFVETKHVGTGGGDYEEECTGCGQAVPEPHRYIECFANIAVGESALGRYAEQVDEENLALKAELAECKEGYHALDRNWEAVHNAAMEAFRGALEMPDASIPEMVIRIREWRDKPDHQCVPVSGGCSFCFVCGKDLREAPKQFGSAGGFTESTLGSGWNLQTLTSPKLFVFTDGAGTYVIAHGTDDVVRVLEEEALEPDPEEGWELVLPTLKIRIQGREQTAAEWLAQGKRGLLCTSDC